MELVTSSAPGVKYHESSLYNMEVLTIYIELSRHMWFGDWNFVLGDEARGALQREQERTQGTVYNWKGEINCTIRE